MNRLIKWFNLIIIKQKGLKRWQRVVTVLAAMITFATTYALILPAITVEKNGTEDVGGMYLEKTAEQDDLLEENALEPTGVSIAADMDNAVIFAYSDDDMSATAVFSTDEVIPEGAELVVNYVDPESDIYTDLSGRTADLLDREFIYDVTTRSFYDYALVCDNVDVTPKTGLVDIQIIFRNNSVEHVNDVVYAGRFVKPSEKEDGFVELAAGDGNAADELVSINVDESPVIEMTDGIITSLSLKGSDLAQSDSIVGILAGNVDEEVKAAAAETDAEIPNFGETQDEDTSGSLGDTSNGQDENTSDDSEEDGTHADDDDNEITTAPPVKTLKASGSDYTVTLTYDESSKIPEGASLAVSEISKDSKEYQTYLDETKKAMGLTEEETLPNFAARFFDIKIMVDGQEFTPDSGLSVEITYAEPLAEYSDTEVNAVHFTEETAEAEVIEANTAEVQENGEATVEFTAESFSVYGVIYTVDFHWEVDGQTYTFSIPGGGFISLERLVDVLGIGISEMNTENRTENDEVSEAARRFAEEVENVEFSSPELVWVGKVNEETTIGELKEANSLKIEYSAELTEAKISEINAHKVEAGDWILISIYPFSSEEALTITMKNGDRFVVRVTDAAELTVDLGGLDALQSGTDFIIYTFDSETKKEVVLRGDGEAEPFDGTEGFATLPNNYRWKITYVSGDGHNRRYTIRNVGTGKYLNLANDQIISDYSQNVRIRDYNFDAGDDGFIIDVPGSSNRYVFRYNSSEGYYSYLATGQNPGLVRLRFYSLAIPEPSAYTITYKPDSVVKGKVSYILNGQPEQTSTARSELSVSTSTNYDENKQSLYEVTASSYAGYSFAGWTYTGTGTVESWGDNGETASSATIKPIVSGDVTLKANFVDAGALPANGSTIDSTLLARVNEWADGLTANSIQVNKTAEVYDYDNRIYEIDLDAFSQKYVFAEDISLSFITDISRSMYFPAKLTQFEEDSTFSPTNMTDLIAQLNLLNGDNATKKNVYYILANPTTDATVYAVRRINGEWRFMDASYDQGIARQDYRSKSGVDEDVYNWYDPYTTLNTSSKVYKLSDFRNRTSNKRLDGKIYFAEDVNYRLDYLKKVVELAGNIIYDLNPDAKIGLVTFAERAQSKGWFGENQFAYTGYANDPNLLDKVDAISPEAKTNQYDGLVKAKAAFSENAVKDSKYKVAILITDGAPNGKIDPDNSNSSNVTWGDENTSGTIRYAADQLKQSGVTLYTVGLSVGNVTGAEDGLKHSATNETFYKAPEDGEELLRDVESILLSLMQKATVTGNVSDVIDPTFYPVTISGEPISEGIYNVGNGQKVDELTALDTWTAGNTPFYTWTKTSDGNGNEVWKVTWYKQELAWKANDTDPSPWKKTIFVKAKEDYMGGNGVSTNSDGSQVDATGWKAIFKGETKTGSLSVTKPFATPYVNVDELGLSENSTEWTVYLGTNVDPESELRALWNKIEVQQVVKSGGTQDDGTRITQNTKMYYTSFPTAQNGTVAERTADKEYPSDNTNATILISDNRYIPSSVFEQLLSQLKEDTDAISRVETSYPYAPYGTKVGEFMITIDRAVNAEAAEDSAPVAHDTKKTGEAVETYKINVGYMAIPSGVENWNTGEQITGSAGKAPDSVHSTNTHVINVFNKKLQIEKKDKDTADLITDKPAVFTLYKSTDGSVPSKADDVVAENGTVASGYAAVGTLTTKTTATATADVPAGKSEAYDFVPLHFGMFSNEADKTTTYYLVETTQPEGYVKSTEVWPITLTISESPTGAAGAATVASGNPYDWTQTATLTAGNQTTTNNSDTVTVTFSVDNEKGVDIEILKVDEKGEPLNLATFRLQKKEGSYQDIKSIKVSSSSEELKYPNVGGLDENSSFVSGTEKVKITKLPDGDYKLVEDNTHTGYIIKQKEIDFKITNGVLTGIDINGIVTFTQAGGTNLALITVINEPGAALPATGGPGTNLIYILGVILTSLAGAGLVLRQKRKTA